MRNTFVEVSLSQIQKNFKAIKSACDPDIWICAVIKADAYGHGLIPVAKSLEEVGVDYFAVAIVEEGISLRKSGIITPILVMAGITEPEITDCINNDLTVTVSSVDKLSFICDHAKTFSKPVTVHLKIDTGMGRIGVQWDRAEKLLSATHEAVERGDIICEGIYSHFADSLDHDFTKLQFERFKQVLDESKKVGLEIPTSHICSSRSVVLYPEYHLGMVRVGTALYGIEPELDKKILPQEILPALSFKTEVVYFKTLLKGDPVGYDRSWKVKDEYERIVTLPVGYADGYPRRLSNKGQVLIRGKRYPVVGKVCMDQTMVSLGKNGEAHLGDKVTLIGTDGNEKISAEEIAELVGTNGREIVILISGRVPRKYI